MRMTVFLSSCAVKHVASRSENDSIRIRDLQMESNEDLKGRAGWRILMIVYPAVINSTRALRTLVYMHILPALKVY